MTRQSRVVLVVASALVCPVRAMAGGPLLVEDGVPYRWDARNPVVLNVDPGPLGDLSPEEARGVILNAVTEWNGVRTSELRVRLGDPLPEDVEGLSESKFYSYVLKRDGTNPVIFDSDGSIIDAIYGPGSGVLGLAGPSLIEDSKKTIVKGFAVFNGKAAVPETINRLRATVTHELGHVFNLGHAQLNGLRVGTSLLGFDGVVEDSDVETMFPLLIASSLVPHPMSTLHRDDVASISSLYPTADFATVTSTLKGRVLDIDGETPIQGLNVIARCVDDPFASAVSQVSGALVGKDPPQQLASRTGDFELRGLAPGCSYKIYIEEVADFFRGGSSVGPLDPPLDVDPSDAAAFLEFWSGNLESADFPPDDPSVGEVVYLSEGAERDDIVFIFNGAKPRIVSVIPPSGSYKTPQDITIVGANFSGSVQARLEGDETFALEGVEVVDSGTVRAIVPAGVTPGRYGVIVQTAKGQSPTGGVEYRVTEPLPAISSIDPTVLENDRPRLLGIEGTDLLGTRMAGLVGDGLPTVDLKVREVFAADSVVVELPAGVFPGAYRVVVTNTEGASAPSADVLSVVELPPVLSGTVSPRSARNRRAKVVRIDGRNLAGTSTVELVRDGTSVSLEIRSTSLGEVEVVVPSGLEAGTYVVEVTNTAGSATGPTEFVVKKGSGGGGGCSAGYPGRAFAEGDLTMFVLFLVALRFWRRVRPRARERKR